VPALSRQGTHQAEGNNLQAIQREDRVTSRSCRRYRACDCSFNNTAALLQLLTRSTRRRMSCAAFLALAIAMPVQDATAQDAVGGAIIGGAAVASMKICEVTARRLCASSRAMEHGIHRGTGSVACGSIVRYGLFVI